jgi:hypothetical protein
MPSDVLILNLCNARIEIERTHKDPQLELSNLQDRDKVRILKIRLENRRRYSSILNYYERLRLAACTKAHRTTSSIYVLATEIHKPV